MKARALIVAAAVLATSAALPASSLASTAYKAGSVLRVDGSPGEPNRITVTYSGSNVQVTETGAGAALTPGSGCSVGATNTVVCPVAGLASLAMNGGDGDDRLSNSAPGPSTLDGGIGDDVLAGGPVSDSLIGGEGNDLLDGGTGADTMSGGAGSDSVSYSTRTNAVGAALAGLANNGEAGENDTIAADVEGLYGGSGNDTLAGNAAANNLSGGDGADTLYGDEGDDFLDGGLGGDVLWGGGGIDGVSYAARTLPLAVDLDDSADDGHFLEFDNVRSDVENLTGGTGNDLLSGDADANVLDGGNGDDTLDGAAGGDTLTGGLGTDTLVGAAGPDAINSRDAAIDQVSCGSESDYATVDAGDTVAGDCETVDTGSAPPGPDPDSAPAPAPAPTPTPVEPDDTVATASENEKVRIPGGPVTITRDGRAPIRVRCPAGRKTPCRGTVSIQLPAPVRQVQASRRSRPRMSRRSRPRIIGKTSFSAASGKTTVVQVKLSRNGRRRVLRARSQRCKVSVSLPGPDGKSIVSVGTVTLKAPKTPAD